MAKRPGSSRSESVTLRIPNELIAEVLDYADATTRGNRSEAIVVLLEMGLATAKRQQSKSAKVTLQDIARQQELSETVAALSEQVSQLSSLLQDSVLQRLTEVETEVGKLCA